MTPRRVCTARRHPDRVRAAVAAVIHNPANHPLGVAALGALRGPEPLHAAGVTAALWKPGATITVAFLEAADPALMAEAVAAAREWEACANLKFVFVGGPDRPAARADVRISTRPDGSSWSLVGTDSLAETDQSVPTMNLGWAADLPRTKHEFGHVLGLVHEHQLPDRKLKFNRAAVYAEFGGPPNDWTPAEIDAQILDVDAEPLTGLGFDVRSIMEYWYPPECLDPPAEIPRSTDLSDRDRAVAALLYPFPVATQPAPPTVPPILPPAVPPIPGPSSPPPAVTPDPWSTLVNTVFGPILKLLPFDPAHAVDFGALARYESEAAVSCLIDHAAEIFPHAPERSVAVYFLTNIRNALEAGVKP